MQKFRVDLSYIGTDFQGWQSQTNGKSIQDLLQQTFTTYFREPIKLIGASRTDTGVHACRQVASFTTATPFEERWVHNLNGMLPRSIGILSIEPVPEDFHPITSAVGKIYRYRLWRGPGRDATLAREAWALHQKFNPDALSAVKDVLIGTHDFSAFCAVDSSAKTRIRTLNSITIDQQGDLIDIYFFGVGFLKHMVRNLVGTLVDVGLGKEDRASVQRILLSKDRNQAGATAPAHALTLIEVCYDKMPTFEELAQRRFLP